jgi:prepilin-type N-terminal cleavage/methylation domain-containing protein/prepilin-type processing-associated H-X9-DG protein
MKRRKNAFTLIELLVVIAIIAILAAILFPVFAQAKMAAKKTASLSNMKQTSLADAMYSNDYDDNLPAGGFWFFPGCGDNLGWNDTALNEYQGQITCGINVGATAGTPNYPGPDIETNPFYELLPYIKSIPMLTGPAAPHDGGAFPGGYSAVSNAGNTSYVVNGGIEGLSTTSSDNPAGLIVFSEGPTDVREGWAQPQNFITAHENAIDDSWVGQLYSNYSGNYAFSDGHAKAMPRTAVTYAMYGLSGTVYDYYSTMWQNNTYHLHNISQWPSPAGSVAGSSWISCGHVDITDTSLATGGIDSTGNPCT